MRRVGVMPFMVGGWSPFDELSTLRRDSQKTSATGCVPHMRISAWLVPAWAGQFAAHLKELGLRASMGKVGQMLAQRDGRIVLRHQFEKQTTQVTGCTALAVSVNQPNTHRELAPDGGLRGRSADRSDRGSADRLNLSG